MRRIFALLVCLLTTTLAAQKESATIGQFLDAQGAPVAAAEVTFATSPLGVYDSFAPATLHKVPTDENGRFRVMLQSNRSYSAWATGPRTAAGCARSKVMEGVIAGSVLTINATTTKDLLQLRIAEVQRLGTGGPFTALIRLDARHGPELSLPITAAGTVALPPLADANLHVRILDADGNVRVGSPSCLGGSIYLTKPREYHFVVRDPNGEPIAGARVAFPVADYLGKGNEPFRRRRAWLAMIESPPTDAAGRTQLSVIDPGALFVAWAADRALTISGILSGEWVDNGAFTGRDVSPSEVPATIEFTLQPTAVLTGRVRDGGTPTPGQGVRFVTDLRVSKTGFSNMSSSIDFARNVHTDAQGLFRIEVPQPASGLRLLLSPRSGDEPPILSLPYAEAPTKPLDFDLSRWPVTTLQVIDATGGPPPSGQVVLLPGDLELPTVDPIVLPVDRAGRVTARLQPGSWLVFATDGRGYAGRLLSVKAGDSDPIELLLKPLARMSGRLLDAAGEPVALARFQFSGSQSKSPDREISGYEHALRHYSSLLNRGLTQPSRTDADGKFELRFVKLHGITHSGGVDQLGSPRVTLVADDGLELRLTK